MGSLKFIKKTARAKDCPNSLGRPPVVITMVDSLEVAADLLERTKGMESEDLLFFPAEEFDIAHYSAGIKMDLLIRLKTGRYMLVLHSDNNGSIKTYMGLRFPLIESWAILPRKLRGKIQTLYDIKESELEDRRNASLRKDKVSMGARTHIPSNCRDS